MMRSMLKSKVFYATVTECKLYYQGSITIDEAIMNEADLLAGERVEVLNVNNGERFSTYVIRGKRESGTICLNGPAARLAHEGDQILILSYVLCSQEEAGSLKAKYVELDGKNKIKNTSLR